jgi:hypothetical protein
MAVPAAPAGMRHAGAWGRGGLRAGAAQGRGREVAEYRWRFALQRPNRATCDRVSMDFPIAARCRFTRARTLPKHSSP